MRAIPTKQLLSKKYLLLTALLILHCTSTFLLFEKSFILIAVSYIFVILLVVLLYWRYKRSLTLSTIALEDFTEKTNLAKESIRKENALALALNKKSSQYSLLKQTLDKFNQTLVLEQLGRVIGEEIFHLFYNSATVLIYLVESETNALYVLFTKKTDPKIVIREKHGDLFDDWVLRHNQSLLVEDTTKDFRFDFERVKGELSRHVGSLIATPLATAHRMLGVLRVESDKISQFNFEDLRFLSTVSHLASLALENSLLYERTEELAIHDGLTGIYLRRFLDEHGKEEFQYAMKQHYSLSLLMIDIDHFKEYNDKFGHRSGDIVLSHIADLLKGIFHRKNQLVARFGGEEFVVLLPSTTKEEALSLASDLRKSIEEGVIFLRRSPIKVTVSIGVASFPQDASSWVELVRQSDMAMYKAKQTGRNRVCSI